MTPKEEAEELVAKFIQYTPADEDIKYEYARQCALIAVDEIRDAIIEINEYDYEPLENYWYRVKQEIEKL
jgi:hypothetical protein